MNRQDARIVDRPTPPRSGAELDGLDEAIERLERMIESGPVYPTYIESLQYKVARGERKRSIDLLSAVFLVSCFLYLLVSLV